jgi:flavodoxin
MKTIVYYYSLTGHCEEIASIIASQMNCNSEKIVEKKKRISKGFLRFINGGSAIKKVTAEIENVSNNPEQFDRIIVVTPFWAASPTPAVRGFIDQYKKELKGKSLGLAMTNLGSDPTEAFQKYKELFPEPIITISLTKSKDEWTEPKMGEKINQFISNLGVTS